MIIRSGDCIKLLYSFYLSMYSSKDTSGGLTALAVCPLHILLLMQLSGVSLWTFRTPSQIGYIGHLGNNIIVCSFTYAGTSFL